MELASLQEKLKEEGWNLSNSGIELVSENGKITDVRTLIKKAVDIDLKLISQGTLPDDINKTKYEQIPGNIILQIQKIKNLTNPKSSESNCGNSSILKLNLTDGIQNVQAIRMDPIDNISLNTFPGSKIRITSENIDVSHCFLLLYGSNTQFLGGKVDALVEKWELNKRLAKHTRDRNGEGGPPPWIGFGQKIVKQTVVTDKNFKSLDLGKNKDSAENSEFEAQRKDAILEATKIGCTKVFGGGNNKLLDYNVQQIVDAGFTIEDAEYALRISKNNLDKALRNLQNKYNKSNKDENSKSNKSGPEEKKTGKNKNRHKDEESAPSLKPSGKVSLFDFLEDKLPFSEPPVEAKPVQEKRNGVPFKSNKPNYKGNTDRSRFNNDDRGPSNKPEPRNQKKSYESSKSFIKSDFSEKKSHADKKSEFGKFESKKNSDKSFGNFKAKYETKNGEYNNKNEFYKNKSSEKRGQGQNSSNLSAIKSHGRTTDVNENKKLAGFGQANEKPPRFQKYQNQQNDNQGVQNWNDLSYNRTPQNEFQLQNSIANLTLQQNIASFQNQNSQEGYGDLLTGVPGTNTKPNNLFYQNVVLPTTQSSESRLITNQNSQPPPPHPPHQSHINTYGSRNVGGFIHQDVKNSTFSNIPNLQDVAYKNNGPLLHGYNDFQSVFGNARAPSNNFPNPQYITSNTNGIPPQPHKTWIWNKGDKCMARYWEDQMYYNAVVTAVSENTCVVRFTDYGNYEEVLQDHCIPITEES